MSRKTRSPGRSPARFAPIFAALGDETRLALVAKLSEGEACSIKHLTAGTRLTRQAVTKHLRVLEGAEIVHSVRSGRENLFVLDPAPIRQVSAYADVVSRHWDRALARLKTFVED
jgi:DNA-binding transcriptional ArsR family regulator